LWSAKGFIVASLGRGFFLGLAPNFVGSHEQTPSCSHTWDGEERFPNLRSSWHKRLIGRAVQKYTFVISTSNELFNLYGGLGDSLF
jgi:hypothetical protein